LVAATRLLEVSNVRIFCFFRLREKSKSYIVPNTIRRISLIPLRIPIPIDRVNCPDFFHEMLHRGGPGGEFGGDTFFGDVPFTVVRIEGDGGPDGWSDSSRYSFNDQNVKPEVIDYAARFLGADSDDIDPRAPHMGIDIGDEFQPALEVQTAVIDWAALQREAPLHTLFGEQIRDRIRVEYWSGFRTPAGVEGVAREARSLGFKGLKLKANLEIDIAGVTDAVFRGGGSDFRFNIDPNGRWKTVEQAVERALAMLEVSPNVLLEDPIYDTPAVAEVRRLTGIPTARTVGSVKAIEDALVLDAADVFNIGNLWNTRIELSEMLENAHMPYWIGSGMETGLMDLASAHFAATQPACTIGSDLVGNLFREDDLLVEPIQFEGGHLVLPEGPGRGIKTDEDAIERYRVGDPTVVE